MGPPGRNFAAGMSGGIAYVLDEGGDFPKRVNLQMVGIEKLESKAEIAEVRAMIEKHLAYTKSTRAKRVLDDWDAMVPRFVKVMPNDYKRMLACIERAHGQGLTGDEAVMAAFEENATGPFTRRRQLSPPPIHDQARWANQPDSSNTCGSCPRTGRPSSASATGRNSTTTWRRTSCASRARAAWTAASPSATRASLSAGWPRAARSTT